MRKAPKNRQIQKPQDSVTGSDGQTGGDGLAHQDGSETTGRSGCLGFLFVIYVCLAIGAVVLRVLDPPTNGLGGFGCVSWFFYCQGGGAVRGRLRGIRSLERRAQSTACAKKQKCC